MKSQRYFKPEDLDKFSIVYISPGHAPSMVTTIGPSGNVNVATFEQTMIVSYRPPRLLLAITSDSDTFKNLSDGSDCVVGFPSIEYIQEAYDAGVKAPRNISELDVVSGIKTFPSKIVKAPSLEQCWVNMECILRSTQPIGDHDIVMLDVVGVSLDSDVWNEDKVKRRTKLPSVYYTTSGHFHELGAEHIVKLSKELNKYDNGD